MKPPLLPAWVPVVVWCGVIFAFSSIPHLGTDLGTWNLVLRKLAHAAEFAVLALLLVRATRSFRVACLLAIIYAISDEVHQTFVTGRQGAPLDVVIDAGGAGLGLASCLLRPVRRRLA